MSLTQLFLGAFLVVYGFSLIDITVPGWLLPILALIAGVLVLFRGF